MLKALSWKWHQTLCLGCDFEKDLCFYQGEISETQEQPRGRLSELIAVYIHRLTAWRISRVDCPPWWCRSCWFFEFGQTLSRGTNSRKYVTDFIDCLCFLGRCGHSVLEILFLPGNDNMDNAFSCTRSTSLLTHTTKSCNWDSDTLSLSSRDSYCNDIRVRIHRHKFLSHLWHAKICIECVHHIQRYEVFGGSLANCERTRIRLLDDFHSYHWRDTRQFWNGRGKNLCHAPSCEACQRSTLLHNVQMHKAHQTHICPFNLEMSYKILSYISQDDKTPQLCYVRNGNYLHLDSLLRCTSTWLRNRFREACAYPTCDNRCIFSCCVIPK